MVLYRVKIFSKNEIDVGKDLYKNYEKSRDQTPVLHPTGRLRVMQMKYRTLVGNCPCNKVSLIMVHIYNLRVTTCMLENFTARKKDNFNF